MKVTLLDYTGKASPDPARHAANILVFTKSTRLEMKPEMLTAIEALPWEQIETELDYMSKTIPSSWEFVHYNFLIGDVTRAFTHQLVRTRTGAYAQQTMRVLNVDGWGYATGPTIAPDPGRKRAYDHVMRIIRAGYNELIAQKTAIEDARGVLPTNILTNIAADFNLRTLAELFRKRESSRTQGEYRDVLTAMKAEVERVHPWAHMFFNRTFDVAARELEELVNDLLDNDDPNRIRMIKLIDQMRQS